MTLFHIAGEIAEWPSNRDLEKALRAAGLKIQTGSYSVRVLDCSHFVFQEYGGDLGDPVIEVDADSLEILLRDAALVSDALAQAGMRHRFEIYNGPSDMVAYLHFEWPLKTSE